MHKIGREFSVVVYRCNMNKRNIPEISLNHCVDYGLTPSQLQLDSDICFYKLVSSADRMKYYLLLSTRTQKWTFYGIYSLAVFFACGFAFLPIPLYLRILLWAIFSTIVIAINIGVFKKKFASMQKYPIMVLDIEKKKVSFYRKKRLAYIQISGNQQEFKFSDIEKVELVATYRVKNGSGYMYSGLYWALQLYIAQTPHLLLLSLSGRNIQKKVGELIASKAQVPFEIIVSSMKETFYKN